MTTIWRIKLAVHGPSWDSNQEPRAFKGLREKLNRKCLLFICSTTILTFNSPFLFLVKLSPFAPQKMTVKPPRFTKQKMVVKPWRSFDWGTSGSNKRYKFCDAVNENKKLHFDVQGGPLRLNANLVTLALTLSTTTSSTPHVYLHRVRTISLLHGPIEFST